MRGRRFVAVAAFGLMSVITAFAQGDAQKVYQQGYDALLEENWGAAREAFALVLLTYPDSSWAEGAQYWLCYVREKMGETAESVFRCNQEFVNQYPGSGWANDARSNMIRIGKQLVRAGKPGYEHVVKHLQASQDDEVQLAALSALRDNQSGEAFRATVNLYDRSRSEAVRRKAVYILGTFRTSEAVAKLIAIARADQSENVRKDAVHALAQIGGDEASAALQGLSTEHIDPQVRQEASRSMVRATTAVPALLQAARDDSQPERASEAMIGLARIRTREVDETLADVARASKHTEVRIRAIDVLSQREDTAWVPVFQGAALTDGDAEVRRAAVHALGRSGRSSAAWVVLKNMLGPKTDSRLRQDVFASLVELARTGNHAAETKEILLNVALIGSDKSQIRPALQGLGVLSARNEVGPLLVRVVLQAKSHEARKSALQMVATVEGGLSVRQLADIIRSETDPEMRLVAVVGLGSSRSDEAVPVLVDAVRNDSDQRVRMRAVQALEIIGTPKARQAIVEIAGGN